MRTSTGERIPWYRIPVVWVVIVVLGGSLIGCAVNVGLALQLSDSALTEVAPSGRFGFAVDDEGE